MTVGNVPHNFTTPMACDGNVDEATGAVDANATLFYVGADGQLIAGLGNGEYLEDHWVRYRI